MLKFSVKQYITSEFKLNKLFYKLVINWWVYKDNSIEFCFLFFMITISLFLNTSILIL